MYVTGLVIAAGASTRLGVPKQLLDYRGTTILGATLDAARRCGFDQLVVTIGGACDEIRARVDLAGIDVVENGEFASGCSSSIRAGLDRVDDRADGIVLLLGDQPEVQPSAVRALVAATEHRLLGVCRYDEGRGHPFWFGRAIFLELRALHGDKAVWKLLETGSIDVTEVQIGGPVPLDVDTWDDYAKLIARPAVAPTGA